MPEQRELLITHMGAQGDGIAESQGAFIFVPFTIAGERVLADVSAERGRLVRVLERSLQRIEPVCRHFGTCGGCSVQHMAPEPYRAWKRDLVTSAFQARGLQVEPDELVEPGGRRRRAVFSVERNEKRAAIGFHEAASHDLVAIEECPVLEPNVVAALPALNMLVSPLVSRRGARMTVTLTKTGLDVQLDGIERRLTPDVRSRLASEAGALKLARLTIGNDVIVETLPPFLSFGAADVVLPSGTTFVQAVAEAEREIARRVVAAVGKVKTVVDLFCGLGAFTFPLAARAKVSAFDGDRRAIEALSAAAKKTSGLKPIAARVRDLFRDPLSTLELNEHDAIVFDPPRAGAEAQTQRMAKSKVKTVVAISCNPATLARDARHLIDGGYKIESATPIDQFVYSAHVEVVAVFRR
jgi:23S rRNA (uracil1939-C5)-methyltransferase